MPIDRTYLFSDPRRPLVPNEVETELSALVDAVNNLSSGNTSFTGITIGSGGVTFTVAGAGLVFKTPDGLHTYKLSIDNDGSIVTEQLT